MQPPTSPIFVKISVPFTRYSTMRGTLYCCSTCWVIGYLGSRHSCSRGREGVGMRGRAVCVCELEETAVEVKKKDGICNDESVKEGTGNLR